MRAVNDLVFRVHESTRSHCNVFLRYMYLRNWKEFKLSLWWTSWFGMKQFICFINYNEIHFEKLWFLLHVSIPPDSLAVRRTILHFIKANQHSRRLNNEAKCNFKCFETNLLCIPGIVLFSSNVVFNPWKSL